MPKWASFMIFVLGLAGLALLLQRMPPEPGPAMAPGTKAGFDLAALPPGTKIGEIEVFGMT